MEQQSVHPPPRVPSRLGDYSLNPRVLLISALALVVGAVSAVVADAPLGRQLSATSHGMPEAIIPIVDRTNVLQVVRVMALDQVLEATMRRCWASIGSSGCW